MPPYHFKKEYWVILAGRLIFVFVFHWFITVVTKVIAYIIPDMPKSLDLKIKREKFLAKEKEKSLKEKIRKSREDANLAEVDEQYNVDLSDLELKML